jgi:hypothetical protein
MAVTGFGNPLQGVGRSTATVVTDFTPGTKIEFYKEQPEVDRSSMMSVQDCIGATIEALREAHEILGALTETVSDKGAEVPGPRMGVVGGSSACLESARWLVDRLVTLSKTLGQL